MKPGRALWVALAVFCLAFGAYQLRQHGTAGIPWYPGCLFRKFTGLLCPGCGMTRAAYATLHGDIGRAFRMNPVGMALLPVAMAGVALETIGWVSGRRPPFRMEVTPRVAWGLACGLILFWILRNIPVWPFSLLAPH